MKKAIVLLLVFALASSAFGQASAPDEKHVDSIRKKVADCADHQRRVVVQTYDNRRLQGVVTESRADDFVLSYASRATTLSYRDVRKIRWESAIGKQVKVGVGAAAVVGVVFGLVVLLGGLRG